MKQLLLPEIEDLISQASQALSSSVAELQRLSKDHKDNKPLLSEEDNDDKAKALQLVLQYRLDTQDALLKLVHINNNLLKALGIGPEHSREMNLDRILYAVGSEDLHQLLAALNHVVDSLLRVSNKYREEQKRSRNKRYVEFTLKTDTKNTKILKHLQQASAQMKYILTILVKVQTKFEEFIKTVALEPVYDHIIALRGPISHFFQGFQNGLEVAHDLYELINQDNELENNVKYLLQEADKALKQLPSVYQPLPVMAPAPDASERLEQRAAAKRLRPFF